MGDCVDVAVVKVLVAVVVGDVVSVDVRVDVADDVAVVRSHPHAGPNARKDWCAVFNRATNESHASRPENSTMLRLKMFAYLSVTETWCVCVCVHACACVHVCATQAVNADARGLWCVGHRAADVARATVPHRTTAASRGDEASGEAAASLIAPQHVCTHTHVAGKVGWGSPLVGHARLLVDQAVQRSDELRGRARVRVCVPHKDPDAPVAHRRAGRRRGGERALAVCGAGTCACAWLVAVAVRYCSACCRADMRVCVFAIA